MTETQWVKLERQRVPKGIIGLRKMGHGKSLTLPAYLDLDWPWVDIFIASNKIRLTVGPTYKLVINGRSRARYVTAGQLPWPIGTTFRVLEQSDTELILEVNNEPAA